MWVSVYMCVYVYVYVYVYTYIYVYLCLCLCVCVSVCVCVCVCVSEWMSECMRESVCADTTFNPFPEKGTTASYVLGRPGVALNNFVLCH